MYEIYMPLISITQLIFKQLTTLYYFLFILGPLFSCCCGYWCCYYLVVVAVVVVVVVVVGAVVVIATLLHINLEIEIRVCRVCFFLLCCCCILFELIASREGHIAAIWLDCKYF